jgi:hypothetical protein
MWVLATQSLSWSRIRWFPLVRGILYAVSCLWFDSSFSRLTLRQAILSIELGQLSSHSAQDREMLAIMYELELHRGLLTPIDKEPVVSQVELIVGDSERTALRRYPWPAS